MFLSTIKRHIYLYPEDGYKFKGTFDILHAKRKEYRSDFGTFDIETSRIEKFTFIYCWSYTDQSGTYFGRTWKDFKTLLDDIANVSRETFVIYIHNLPYEFSFLASIFVGEIRELFATDVREPVKFTYRNFEFRCSYKLTNMSLSKFCESEQVYLPKLKGYDFNVVRYSDTEMSDFEISYSCVDTICLYDALIRLMTAYGDDITTIPITSTGYVRRDARKAVLCNNDNRTLFLREKLSRTQYTMCQAAVRGGNTHANYLYVGKRLRDIDSFDIKSSYPHKMLCCQYPVGRPYEETPSRTCCEMPFGMCTIAYVEFYGLKIKDNVYFPYISYAKCLVYRNFSDGKKNLLNDNGRVVEAAYLLVAITNIDFDIIKQQYSWDDVHMLHWITFESGYLPLEYRQFIYEMFKEKCKLENGDRYFYMKIKNKLNSTFGMMLTSITREDITYDGAWQSVAPDIDKALKNYYNNKKSFLSYQHGIFVTAHARKALQDAIDMVGIDAIYCDTDSVKCFSGYKHMFDALNDKIHSDNMLSEIQPIVTIGSKSWELGLWEDESGTADQTYYKEFVTYGAKKYAYEYTTKHKGERYGVTVAGLSKQKSTSLIEQQGLDWFKEGVIFDESVSGRMTAHYDDRLRYEIRYINGHMVEDTSNVSLIPTTYTLGLSKDYETFLEKMQKGY